jgi:hypothetical protein
VLLLALLAVCGCGSGWTSISPEVLRSQAVEEGDVIRLTLEDGQVFDFHVARVEFPYVWGQRFVGERMPRREMRVDLQNVSKIEVRNSG